MFALSYASITLGAALIAALLLEISMTLSTKTVQNHVDNHRASCAEPQGAPLHGLLSNFRPHDEPAKDSRLETAISVALTVITCLIVGMSAWIVLRAYP